MKYIRTHEKVESKNIGEDISCKHYPKTADVAILILDKEHFKARNIARGKEDYFIMIKRSTPRRYSNSTHKFILLHSFKIYKAKVTWLKGEIDKSTVKEGDF